MRGVPNAATKPLSFRSAKINVWVNEDNTRLWVNVDGVQVLRAYGCHIEVGTGGPNGEALEQKQAAEKDAI